MPSIDDHTHESALSALAGLYADLERETARLGLTCKACGECCCFDRADHVLYVSRLEADWLRRVAGIRPASGPDRCPYQEGDVCTARKGRMLGCRLHFCSAAGAAREKLDALSCACHARLKRIHDEHNIEWRYRPLYRALDD